MSAHRPSGPTDWLAAARAGDAAAWGLLLEHFRPYLTLLAAAQLSRRLTVKAEPGDVVQEALLQAHRKFGTFRGGTGDEFAGWLEAVLASRVAKLVRRYYGSARRDLRLERELEHEFADSTRHLGALPAAPGESPSHGVASREQAVRVAAAVQQLTPDQRQVIVGRHIEALTFPQLAERLGRTTDAVTQLWVRAIKRLRQLLEDGS